MDLSAALPTFFVTLREGVEAALVVGIVLACLQKADKSSLYSWVSLGIIAGIFSSVLVGLGLGGVIAGLARSNRIYAPVIQEFLEAGFGIVAIILLSWMLIWLTQQAKSVKGEVEAAIESALQNNTGAGWGVFTLVFIAVLREGFETVLFIVAKFQEGVIPATIGAIAGLTSAIIIGFLLFKLGVKINLRLFFQVMGVFLLLIVGGLVIGALKHFDGAIALLGQLNPGSANLCFSQASCILGFQVWNAENVLPDSQFPGILLKALLGYREHLYLTQLVAYLLFLFVVGGAYFQSLTPRQNSPDTKSKKLTTE